MIDFKEELKKYNPILELEEVETSLKPNEIEDIQDLLQILLKTIKTEKE